MVATSISVKLLRKGSRGIEATLENAEHHAKSCLSIIKAVRNMLVNLPYTFTWEQGNNIHIITSEDGRKISFRPYYNDGVWGIDVLSKISRSTEVRLMTLFESNYDVVRLESFLRMFFKCPRNKYGKLANASKAE